MLLLYPPGRRLLRFVLVLLLLSGVTFRAQALQGLTGIHDPSTIIKQGNTYWTFATGDGIYSLYSTDLVKWTPGPRAVFPNNLFPAWIKTKVPGFQGIFWAPECFFMNGKYYLYYSCSTFGSRTSAIGLVTNPTLDPTSPDYRWTDQGEVISTSGNNDAAPNAIDPAIYRDANNRLWMAYGSFFGGLRITELDPATGKLLNTIQYAVGNNGAEAAYVKQHGTYYYLFINRGACCQGLNSTYYVLVGRSLSPTGPFLDQNGVNLNNGGGTVILSASGRYRGPGHAGILEEGGVNYFSHHYYDSYDNGAAKLGLAKLTWSATGWPVVSRDWVTTATTGGTSSRYTIATAAATGFVWQSKDCTGAAGKGITQEARTGNSCQLWDFMALGNGDYKITSAQGGLSVGVAGCSDASSAVLQLGTFFDDECQKFHLDRAKDGSLVFSSLNGNRVAEVPGASGTAGAQLALFDYNGCTCQRWLVTNASTGTATTAAQALAGVSIYPVPVTKGSFTIDLGGLRLTQAVDVEIFNLQGQAVYRREFSQPQPRLPVETALTPGLYLVRVRQGVGQMTQRLTVL